MLIPKKVSANSFSDYHPISLYNLLYKLISKTITNRLKPIMHSIIYSNQSVFIPGRLIIDNIIVAHELLHFLKKNKKGKVENMAMKLNMSKTYDWVEWPYIEAMMKALGFNDKWIKLVISSISTVTYLLLINGKPGISFHPSSGLRQRDLLSSYIFLMCAEWQSCLINNEKQKWEIQGLVVAKRGASISHILFVNSIIMFYKAIQE